MSSLGGSVGEGGTNCRRDVKYVQFLLCDWRYCNEGIGIDVDGIVGPITKAAIKEFQTKHTGIVDGRVDPTGPAIQALERIHIDNMISNLTESVSKYGYLRPTLPAFGPLSWSNIVSRYLRELYDSFSD
jgi:peptidoglycan hydrolase-like protein with peptidoglycan-binding domain